MQLLREERNKSINENKTMGALCALVPFPFAERWKLTRFARVCVCRIVNRIHSICGLRSMNWSRRRNTMLFLHQLSRVIEINFAGWTTTAHIPTRFGNHNDGDNEVNEKNKRNRNKYSETGDRQRHSHRHQWRTQCNANEFITEMSGARSPPCATASALPFAFKLRLHHISIACRRSIQSIRRTKLMALPICLCAISWSQITIM